MGKKEYIDWLHNDILMLIGFKMELEKENNKTRVKLWDLIDKKIGKPTLIKIKTVLKELPIYALLALVGYNFKNLKVNSALY